MSRITPFLWFDTQAEEAARFYVSIFRNSRILSVTRNERAAGAPAESVFPVEFELEGQPFTALNGGPVFHFNPAISLFVHCADQAEVDAYWEALSAGGEKGQCGWLTDRYGLSWQIVPDRLGELMQGEPAKAAAMTQAMLKMTKLDVAELQRAYDAG
ncbi:MAG: VOC family protein [Anaerolineaceae bacterium]|nr:VOC family protein [Anaerolineaceae bacterium]